MELKYLYTFQTILETGSFQKAAERLNYAQSTITLQMQILERELSVRLFEKIGRKMELTQAGKDLLPYIDSVIETVQKIESYGKQESELTGTLRIAMPETLLSNHMQRVIRNFRKEAPNVKLSLQIPNCYVIREQLLSGAIDLGIHYDVGGYGNSLIVERLSSYPLVLIGSASLGKDDCDFVTKGQRKELCLLTMDSNSIYHKQFDEYLRAAGIALNGEMELGSLEAIKWSVVENLGVAYLPRFTVEEELRQGMVQELQTAIPCKKINAVYTYHKNKWLTPAMKLMIRLLKEQNRVEAKAGR